MGMTGQSGPSGTLGPGLMALRGGSIGAGPDLARTWEMEDLRWGICGDATSAEGDCPAVRMLFEGRIHDRAGLIAELGLCDPALPDAALLLHAWLRFQEDFPRHAVGEYTFALWEPARRRLVLGSDPLGGRAMYYWQCGPSFRFASEIGALLACAEIPIRLEETQVALWLIRRPQSGGETLYQGIWRVPPGQVLLLEDGQLSRHRFWQPLALPGLRLGDPRGYAEGLRHHLEEAVRCRIQPDRPVGSHLSGGLDSSTVTTFAARILARLGRTATAFTAVPAGPLPAGIDDRHFGDERHHAASVIARHANLDHVLVANNAMPLFEALDYFSGQHFTPVLNAANAPWIVGILAEAQRRGVQTLLAGSAGNLTASYNGAWALWKLLAQGRLFDWMGMVRDRRERGVSLRSCLGQSLGQGRSWLRRQLLDPLRRARGASQGIFELFPIRPEFFRRTGLPSRLEHDWSSHAESSRDLRLERLQRIHGKGLATAARRCFGLEWTDPMADRRLVEYCLSLPEEAFCRGGLERSLIRDAMEGELPDLVRLERRIGLQAADAATLVADNREAFAAELRLMASSDLVNQYLDLPGLFKELEQVDGCGQSALAPFSGKLLNGVNLGRFVRRLEDGSLLAPLRGGQGQDG